MALCNQVIISVEGWCNNCQWTATTQVAFTPSNGNRASAIVAGKRRLVGLHTEAIKSSGCTEPELEFTDPSTS